MEEEKERILADVIDESFFHVRRCYIDIWQKSLDALHVNISMIHASKEWKD